MRISSRTGQKVLSCDERRVLQVPVVEECLLGVCLMCAGSGGRGDANEKRLSFFYRVEFEGSTRDGDFFPSCCALTHSVQSEHRSETHLLKHRNSKVPAMFASCLFLRGVLRTS